MKFFFLAVIIGFLSVPAQAQFTKASLQASGLTCSMCSKAVQTALAKVPFVDKIDVDLKKQEYHLTFKKDHVIDFDALSNAVEAAGFSVANLKVTADFPAVTAKKDAHLKIGNTYFHFLNAANQSLSGSTTFNLVDKHFVPAKTFKKWSAASKMECVQSGKAAACCTSDGMESGTRVYHAVI